MPKTKTDQLSLIIFHLNTRSLVKHYDELESQLGYLESPPDILCLTETWLKDNMTPYCFKLSGYKTLVSKTRPFRGGGVMIQCREAVKSEIYSATDSIREQMRYQKDELTLKMLSETEMLENYNRRDNLRIMGMSERITTDANNRTIWESSDKTISNVVELASDIGVALAKKDISIAHRLPSNKNERPIIVRFTRRVSKVEILRNKRKLRENDTTMNVSIVEDLTRARLRFHNLMKSDTRIESTWTREENLFYKW